MSTALTYLAAARERTNLTVRAGTLAARVELDGGRATGVRLAGDELGGLGIAPTAPLRGVGRNLVEHPRLALDLPVRVADDPGPRFQAMVTWGCGGHAGPGGSRHPASPTRTPNASATRSGTRSTPTFHPVGTCRMGPSPDDGAVVDARGRVHGVEQLVVADASVMPEIPAAGTNLPTIMVAERIAAFMREST